MALSDRSIREQTAEGRIVVDDDDTQPASIDLHLNRLSIFTDFDHLNREMITVFDDDFHGH